MPSGANGPVGTVWIDLTEPTYGIHGTPEPEIIGKVGSHGCVRWSCPIKTEHDQISV
ncbi:L,D-transpeptidase [Agrobacterium larrymoorei]|uniref:L,D-transpeptidase n=1 Tax=Agrobacterium larrymoorei TaxID=160699 RepID=UPI0039A57263